MKEKTEFEGHTGLHPEFVKMLEKRREEFPNDSYEVLYALVEMTNFFEYQKELIESLSDKWDKLMSFIPRYEEAFAMQQSVQSEERRKALQSFVNICYDLDARNESIRPKNKAAAVKVIL